MKWDREKLPEPNLHVYGKDDTKVYNMRKWPKKGGSKNLERKRLRNTSLKKNSGLVVKLLDRKSVV